MAVKKDEVEVLSTELTDMEKYLLWLQVKNVNERYVNREEDDITKLKEKMSIKK